MPTRHNQAQRVLLRVMAFAPVARFAARVLHHIDSAVLRASAGRTTLTSALSGLPVVMLTTTGAKSGLLRTVPLLAIEDGERLGLIASNWGQLHYPAWCHNLRANPQATALLRGQSARYRAHEADANERARIWQRALAMYPGFAAYGRRIGNQRELPVFVLEKENTSAET